MESIASEWTQNQFSGWPAACYLFQACTIPLLSLYTFREDSLHTEDWNQQVRKAMELLKEMEPWSIAAKRTYELISHLYDARSGGLEVDTPQRMSVLIPQADCFNGAPFPAQQQQQPHE